MEEALATMSNIEKKLVILKSKWAFMPNSESSSQPVLDLLITARLTNIENNNRPQQREESYDGIFTTLVK